MDLIGRFQGRFLVTDHVESEIADDYPEQKAGYHAAVAAGLIDMCPLNDLAELAIFGRLQPGVLLGAGECSAIAVALARGYAIAMDDGRAIKLARREAELMGAELVVIRTQDIMVALINTSILTVDEADQIKSDWEKNHRFRLKAPSFRNLL